MYYNSCSTAATLSMHSLFCFVLCLDLSSWGILRGVKLHLLLLQKTKSVMSQRSRSFIDRINDIDTEDLQYVERDLCYYELVCKLDK